MPQSVGSFAIAFFVTLILTPIIRAMCVRYSLNADPNPIIATHKKSIPTLGGVAVFIALLLALGFTIFPQNKTYFFKLAFGLFPIFIMGIIDDLKNLSFKFKGLMEIILVILFILIFKLKPGFDIFLPLDYFLMILWFVGIINAFNLIDIMDGLASGIALIASIGFMVIASQQGRSDLVIITGALSGAYLAFLYYNFNPAKIFLGDNGSLVMGLSLAYVGFELVGHEPISAKIMAPVIILLIPIFEVILLIVRRLKKKISIFKGSPDHFGLLLQALGNSIPTSAIISYAVSLALALIGIWVGLTSNVTVQIIVSAAVVVISAIMLSIFVKIKVPEK